jgi:thiamine pyrophosphate-dependent acetolactate synthase large subunit-like protein
MPTGIVKTREPKSSSKKASSRRSSAISVGAPFITVVLEDGSYSLIKLSQEGKALPRYGVDFGPIDTVRLAAAWRRCGRRARTSSHRRPRARPASGGAWCSRSL